MFMSSAADNKLYTQEIREAPVIGGFCILQT